MKDVAQGRAGFAISKPGARPELRRSWRAGGASAKGWRLAGVVATDDQPSTSTIAAPIVSASVMGCR